MSHPLTVIALAAILATPALADPAFAAPAPAATPEALHALAPTGTLRIGVYRGSPTSIVEGPTPAETRGVGLDLGQALATSLGLPAQLVVFPTNDALLTEAAAGHVDVLFTNATPERAEKLDFTRTFMDVQKSVLVPADSPLAQLTDLGRPGLHIGVSLGSSTAAELKPLYPLLVIEPVPTLKQAIDLLAAHKLDGFATNDAILYQMSDSLPGAQVLPGSWGFEHFAAAIPKSRQPALPALQAFMDQAGANGTVATAITRANLRGTVPK